jgi:hypothetical protein
LWLWTSQLARGVRQSGGRAVADVAEFGAAQDSGGEFYVANEMVDREASRCKDTSKPPDLCDAIDGTGSGVFECPCDQIAAVVITPGLFGEPVAFQVIRVDAVVEIA